MEDINPKLDKILGLLAKAESTAFEAERDLFLAKARELMAQYRIDEADIAAAQGEDEIGTSFLNLGSGPYVNARWYLLDDIAKSFDCRTVSYSGRDGKRVEVFGFESDRRTVLTLYTSLLEQATSASVSAVVPDGESTVSYRRSFLFGFGERIRERLAEVRTVMVEKASGGSSTALVLVERGEQVGREMKARYPSLKTASVSGMGSASGGAAGRRAGGSANLSGAQGAVGGGRRALGAGS